MKDGGLFPEWYAEQMARFAKPPKPSRQKPEPPERLDADDNDRARLAALERCIFVPASYDKRFVRDVAAQVRSLGKITARQRENVARLRQRYRRQIKADVP